MLSSHAREAAAVCLVLCVVYIASAGFVPSSDTLATVFAPVVTIESGSWTITPHNAPFMFDSDAADPRTPHAKYYLWPTRWPGNYVNAYGPLPGLMLLAPMWLLHWLLGDLREHVAGVWVVAKLCCSLLAALSAAFVYLAARSCGSRRLALLVALAFALGTVVWSVASQTPYQQAFALPWLALGIWLALSGMAAPFAAFAAGSCLGCASVLREPLLLYGAALGLTLLRRAHAARWGAGEWPRLVAFGLGLAAPLLGLVLYKRVAFGTWLGPSQLQRAAADYGGEAFGTPLATGVSGVLLSPSRGLLVYSPFLLFSLLGAARVLTQPRWSSLRPFLWASAGLVLLYAKWSIWWGGWCFGPRLLIDVLPVACLLLVPALGDLRSRVARAGFALLLSVGIFNSGLGAFAYDLLGWDAREAYAVMDPDTRAAALYMDRNRAQLEAAATGHVLAPVRLDIDKPQFRHRLWRVWDSPLPFYATHFSESRARRSAVMQRAIDATVWHPLQARSSAPVR